MLHFIVANYNYISIVNVRNVNHTFEVFRPNNEFGKKHLVFYKITTLNFKLHCTQFRCKKWAAIKMAEYLCCTMLLDQISFTVVL